MIDIACHWKGGMTFAAQGRGHEVLMDVMPEQGGANQGMTPKMLVLAGIAGCTGIDVISILQKMRTPPKSLSMAVEADTKSGNPSVFTHVRIRFDFEGDNLPADNIQRAVDLSQTKYCSVSAMIARSAEITYEIRLNGQTTANGRANFE